MASLARSLFRAVLQHKGKVAVVAAAVVAVAVHSTHASSATDSQHSGAVVASAREWLESVGHQLGPRWSAVAVLLSSLSALWLVSVPLRNASIVDSFWSIGFLLVALVYKYHWEPAYGAYPLRQDLVLVCTALWAFRLSGYITWRNWGLGEDYRYQAFRRYFGPSFWWISLFQTFILQGVLCAIISQSIYAAIRLPSPPHLNLLDLAASGVWLVGFGFEAIADLQLARFKANAKNRGRLLTSGLFAYTRHPNYFGNATMFAAYYLFALNTDGGWATWYAPALMTFLLTKVSGVALLEKGLAKSKPGFEDYVKGTSAFIPWFPAAKAAASRPAKTN